MKNPYPFATKRQPKLYSYRAVDDLIQRLTEKGYEHVVFDEGCLGSGSGVLIAPDDEHYHFVYREVFVNEWESAQTIRKCSTISKSLQKKIDAAYERERVMEG